MGHQLILSFQSMGSSFKEQTHLSSSETETGSEKGGKKRQHLAISVVTSTFVEDKIPIHTHMPAHAHTYNLTHSNTWSFCSPKDGTTQ